MTLQEQTVLADITVVERIAERGGRAGAIGDVVFRAVTFLFALLVLLILGGVIVALVEGAVPALRTFGFSFVLTEVWNPVTEKFGALAPIYGTLVTSAIAMVVGIPVAFGVAVFITEICPLWLKRPLATMTPPRISRTSNAKKNVSARNTVSPIEPARPRRPADRPTRAMSAATVCPSGVSTQQREAPGPPVVNQHQDECPSQTGLPSGPTICFQLSSKIVTAFAGIGM